jgi:uncharacterized protein (TIGR03435 family)
VTRFWSGRAGFATVAWLLAASPLNAWQQPQATSAAQEFDVASVKPNPSGGGISVLVPGHGNLMVSNATLKHLIGYAYHLAEGMISGPSWLDSARFDIFAKGKGNEPDSEVQLMTQSLLAQRFGLRSHRETKDGPVYFLVPTNGGLKAPPLNTSNPRTNLRPSPALPPGPHWSMGVDASMEEFGAVLTNYVGRPVLDQTGIAGKFHLALWWGKDPDTDPDIFSALQEQLGLKLKAGRSQVEVLVIDHVEKEPTAN